MANLNNPFLQQGNPLPPSQGIPQVPTVQGAPATGQTTPAPEQQQEADPRAQKKDRWRKFLEFVSQPEVSQGLLTAGAQLLQPRQPGQSQMGAIGQAAVAGQQAGLQSVQRQEESARAERQEERQDRRLDIAERRAEQGERRLDIQGREAESQAALRKKQGALYDARVALTEAEIADLQRTGTEGTDLSGKINSTAQALYDLWSKEEGLVEEMGGTSRAFESALSFSRSLHEGKHPSLVRAELFDTIVGDISPELEPEEYKKRTQMAEELYLNYVRSTRNPAEAARGRIEGREATERAREFARRQRPQDANPPLSEQGTQKMRQDLQEFANQGLSMGKSPQELYRIIAERYGEGSHQARVLQEVLQNGGR